MALFHITDEGQALRRGFNFYPLSNRHCFGLKGLKLGRWILHLRYSAPQRRWILRMGR